MTTARHPYPRAHRAQLIAEAKVRAHALRRGAEIEWLEAVTRGLRALAGRAVAALSTPRPQRQLEA